MDFVTLPMDFVTLAGDSLALSSIFVRLSSIRDGERGVSDEESAPNDRRLDSSHPLRRWIRKFGRDFFRLPVDFSPPRLVSPI
jgi:hypothetical protein